MLTDVKVRTARGGEKAIKLADGGGLYLFVTVAGTRVWRLKYRIERREKVLTLGRYPALSLAAARAARDEAKRVLRTGRDPAIAQRLARAVASADIANTFEVIARAWHAQHAPRWTETHAGDVLASLVRDAFPLLGDVPIRDITPQMVLAVLRPIEKRPAVETAHRVRQRMSATFVYAISIGVADADPAAVVRGAIPPPSRGRQPAIIDLEGVRQVLRDAEAIPAHPGTRLALRLMALTVLRSGTLRGTPTDGEFVSLDGGEPMWRIPESRMKIKKFGDHFVPLARQTCDVIRAAQRLAGRGPLLFPSPRHAHRPMSENAIGYLLNRAGYHARHVPHGWRAAFSSIMNERHRVDRAIIDLMLAHVSKDRVEAAYNRAEHMDRRRELAQEWADLLLEGMPSIDALLLGSRR